MSAPVLVTVPDPAPPYDGEPAPATPSPLAPPLPAAAVPDLPVSAAPAPADAAVGKFARILVEAIGGSRPAQQLAPLMTERARLHLRRIVPLFAGSRPRAVRVLTAHPAAEVAEATVILSCGDRTRALAFRLERHGPAGWIYTDIEAG